MTVTLPTSTTTDVNSDDVRMFMRDYANNNLLLDQVEFGEAEVNKALEMAVDEWNAMVPITADTASNIPKSILLLGAAAWLCMSESFLQLRNQATYQDGQVQNVGVDDKHLLYIQMSRALKEEWKTTAREYKKAVNMAGGYGFVGSGYRHTTRLV